MSCYFKFSTERRSQSQRVSAAPNGAESELTATRATRGAFWAWPLRLGLGGRSTLAVAPPCSHRHSARVAQGLLSSFVHGGGPTGSIKYEP